MSEQPTGDHIPEWTQLDRLRKAREDAGLEQAELAERIGIGRATVGNYERGVTPIKRPVLLSWAMATGVPLAWLKDGIEVVPTPGLPVSSGWSRHGATVLPIQRASEHVSAPVRRAA